MTAGLRARLRRRVQVALAQHRIAVHLLVMRLVAEQAAQASMPILRQDEEEVADANEAYGQYLQVVND